MAEHGEFLVCGDIVLLFAAPLASAFLFATSRETTIVVIDEEFAAVSAECVVFMGSVTASAKADSALDRMVLMAVVVTASAFSEWLFEDF